MQQKTLQRLGKTHLLQKSHNHMAFYKLLRKLAESLLLTEKKGGYRTSLKNLQLLLIDINRYPKTVNALFEQTTKGYFKIFDKRRKSGVK